MHSRFLAGWRGVLLAATVASLVLLPATAAFAGPLKNTVDRDSESGLTVRQFTEEGIGGPTLYPRTTYAWPFATGPYYGDVDASRRDQPGVLWTEVGTFDLGRGQLAIPEQLRVGNRLGELPAQYFVLQVHPDIFASGGFDGIRQAIEAQGGKIDREMPVAAFVVRLTPGAFAAVQGQPGVIALEPYEPAFKINPNVGRAPLPDPFKAVSDVYDLDVVLHSGEDAGIVAQTLAGMGGNVLSIDPDAVRVEINRDRLAAIAALEPVDRVLEHYPSFLHAEETTNVMQTGFYCPGGTCGPVPYHTAGIQGDGQVLMVLDSGIQLDAGDLSSTHTDAGTAGPGHRKVLAYETTNQFGGTGDLLGCDAPQQGAFTHGHTVSATALGWATNDNANPFADYSDPAYGAPWYATDTVNKQWKLNGVAPRAKLVAYDGQVTPSLVSCSDPANDGILPGNVQTALQQAHDNFGAKTANFSWGNAVNQYGLNAQRIDTFLDANRDSLVFVSAGNNGDDADNNLIPDPSTMGDPATCKNCVSVGSTGNANDLGTGTQNQDDRSFFSSAGPVIGNRTAPLLMAPGQERGNMGIASEFSCRSGDNNQTNPVQCDVVQGVSGTSFSSPAAAGAALLVRDYFAQGFYPDGTASNPGNAADQHATISGALLKALLIASADWVGDGNNLGTNETIRYRFNREQGYGRIQLDNVLPLQSWGRSPVGLIVEDGDTATNPPTGLGLPGSIGANATQPTTFNVCDASKELRVALAWTEPQGQSTVNNLDLELESPSGKIYYGNYFTDDNNRNGTFTGDPAEDCPSIDGTTGQLDASPWSLPTCANSVRDDSAGATTRTFNTSEGIFLSPDPLATGTVPSTNSQIEAGDWTLRVKSGSFTGSQTYAVAVAGGVCLGSSARFDQGSYRCNSEATVTINEVDEATDPGGSLTPTVISGRTTVQVLVDGVVVDEETGLTFTQPDPSALQFVSDKIVLTDGTAPDPGNGALDVVDGATIKVIYADETGGNPDPDKERTNTASVDCSVAVGFGNLVFSRFGLDDITDINGGCERNLRNGFEFGFPDHYMDAGEVIDYGIAFFNDEPFDLEDATATLRCVEVDSDSPADCRPGTAPAGACTDPNRENNPPCTEMTILDSPKQLGNVPAGAAMGARFTIQMASSITGTPTVEMVLGVSSKKSGKGVAGLAVARHKLDVDETSLYYSTDFPTGGSEVRDYNNSETAENPSSNVNDFFLDYRVESRTWSDLTKGGTLNTTIRSPWNFDTNNGAFTSGLGAISDENVGLDIIAQWGEDKNFNNVLDAGEDRDPANGVLDQNWSTRGGCGWQTRAGGQTTGGAWHTGRIDVNTLPNCLVDGNNTGQCQSYEKITGEGTKGWFELLLTPVVEKVNQDTDVNGDPLYTVEFENWAWNMALDLKDGFALFSWELDTDTTNLEPVGLVNDGNILNSATGPFSPRTDDGSPNLSRPVAFGAGSSGYPMFAPVGNANGTTGNNRVGRNSCYFDTISSNATPGLVGPPDDDVNNDGDGQTDEYVTGNGPIRNFDITTFNGPDMRFTTLEDIYGPSGNSFQGALGFFIAQDPDAATGTPPQNGFGAAIDDMVLEWREFRLDKDSTDCATGECAALDLQSTNFFEGSAILTITLIEKSPDAVNDCNLDGTPDGTTDCDGNGQRDVPVKVTSNLGSDPEIAILNQTGNANGAEFKGTISISSVYNVPGTLFVQRNGTDLPEVNVDYQDDNDGTGSVCNNNIDPAGRGLVRASINVSYPAGRVSVKSVRLTDNGDNDGIADTNETVNMFITVRNNSGVDLDNVVARLSTNSPRIDCISDGSVALGALAKGETKEGAEAFVFKVASDANRTSEFQDFAADFTITLSADRFDALIAPQKVTLDLDENISGGGTPTTFFEDFEVSSGFGKFTTMTMDVGKGNNTLSDGYRCQYNNPDFINANSYGNTDCFVGINRAPVPETVFAFHLHDAANSTSAPDGGRAFSGTRSVHSGSHNGNPDDDTTWFSQLDAIRTTNPIFLGYGTTNPELSFKQQISLVDSRTVNAPAGETPDRGIVMLQLSNAGGTAQGNWIKLFPYQNVYDVQGTDNFFECMFDPIDDGNNEDSFFDPTDPDRRLGPSSTCFPEFAFAYLGNTDYRNKFTPDALGRASDGPGLQGAIDRGTWVESRFNLARFKGRSIRLRFLYTSIHVVAFVSTIEQLFDLPSGWPGDDGWYIDDVRVEGTLTSAATVAADNTNNGGLPATCATNCTTLTAALTSDQPGDTTPAPGYALTLSAETSHADQCVNGTLQYQFWIDGDANGVLGDPSDSLLRDWTDNPVYIDAPSASTDYGVIARCSSAPACGSGGTNTAFLPVTVTCPSTGTIGGPFGQAVGFSDKTTLSWTTSTTYDAIRGDLGTLRTSGTFNGSVQACLANDATGTSVTDATDPTSGNGLYYLVRGGGGAGACNATPSWGTGAGSEQTGRDSEIGADGNTCP